ncbi:hypothetical protein IFM89_011593 [Coptis chinensis]|uniref:Fanconi anemia group D2 protein n=1 Tax=Coptis chinensis TaxID=261450 RepID=A0A835H286_9MAGN|nr:hypothetical protein IFM89_011593 [Coptis chinensis]
MLQEDSEIIVPVLDSFSSLHLSDELKEQVVTIGLSFIRTIEGQYMPLLLRFLLLSAESGNARRIVGQIRMQLKFVGGVGRGKGKLGVDNFEGLVLEALRSSLRFKNVLCQEVLNELKSIDKAEYHRVIDVWLLILIYMNGGTLQKNVEKLVKKKIMDDCLGEALFDQCIHGHRELVQEYFPSFLSVSEYLLACKEQKAREFGIHLYISLFDEFTDTYSRHEILGALVTHIGSGVIYEVSSALEAMVLLASKYSQELITLSSYINGILDYIEGFNDENIHKVYEVFSHLALSARSNADSVGSSIANELLIIVRKQVSNQELKYKKMGLIGTLKIVSCLGHIDNATHLSSSQKTNCEESLELLRMSLDSCKSCPLPLIMFYDELIALLERKRLQPAIIDWIGRHVGDFESIFYLILREGSWFQGVILWSGSDSTTLQTLPAYFLLLSVVERLTNQGSLGGIDALLGCPLCLPSPKLNAFCTQVTGRVDCTSQTARDEIITKLLKRLRNLVFLESLLNTYLKMHPLYLPELRLFVKQSESFNLSKPNLSGHIEKKNEKNIISQSTSSDKKLKRKSSNTSDDGNLKQPTILEVLRRAGAVSQEVPNEGFSDQSCKRTKSQHSDCHADSNGPPSVEISAVTKILDGQRFKFRELSVDCLSILTFSRTQDNCCSDPAAELPLHLYLLRELCHNLDCLTRDEICQEHWKFQSASAGNPDIPGFVVFKSSVAGSVFKEVLRCLSKMLNLPDIKMNTPVLLDLLNAFQPIRIPDSLFSGIQPIPSPGNIDYMYCGIFSFLEGVLDSACSYSVLLASEVLVTLESIVSSAQSFLDKLLEGSGKSTHLGFVQKVIPLMQKRLGTYAHQLLTHNWDSENFENGSKSKGEIIQRILHIYFENSESTADLLEEFACSILPQAPSCNTRSSEEAPHGFPTLCATTFVIWYRVSVKEVTLLEKSRANIQVESVKGVLSKLHQSVNVVVSLVNMCKAHDKVAVHALAVKYGGKFVDSFLKVFDFLQAHFQVHGEIIIQLGSKRTMITTKIPAAKRSMERFLFRVKALLHNTSNGCTFWMGNLKHKDLFGQVVSSQLYADENNDIDEDAHVDMDLDVAEQPLSNCSLHDGEDGPAD